MPRPTINVIYVKMGSITDVQTVFCDYFNCKTNN